MSPFLLAFFGALLVASSSKPAPRGAVYGPRPPRPGPPVAPEGDEEKAILQEHIQLLTSDAVQSGDLEFVLGARSELGRLRESLGLPPSDALVETHLCGLVATATRGALESESTETIESLRDLLAAFGQEYASQVEALTWSLDILS